MEKFILDENIHDGHRGRMRAKLLSHGRSIFDTYELLEMLLYGTIPYKDTNPIAKRLLDRFGSLDGVLCAEEDELCSVETIWRSSPARSFAATKNSLFRSVSRFTARAR